MIDITTNEKVLIAMSGGVDSSVAALLMKESGYECTGAMLRLFHGDAHGDASGTAFGDANGDSFSDARGEAYDEASGDAGDIAHRLQIPLIILDSRDLFKNEVIKRFTESYLNGATPNPCIECNMRVKLARLADYAEENGFAFVATGHYAQTELDQQSGRALLKKGVDTSKDQSYMLYKLTQRQLKLAKFPLGGLFKRDVKLLAEANGFPNAKKRESQDICFIPNGDYPGFIEEFTGIARQSGNIVDDSGNVLGRHSGATQYTIGQRKGLNLASPSPLYVYAKSMADNTVYVGSESKLYSKSLVARHINLIPFQQLHGRMKVAVKTRYRAQEQNATIEQISEDTILAEFDSPQRAITRGQSAVFYDGDVVVGGGEIHK